MKVNIFTAADFVNTYSGKLTIVGAFDNIEQQKCPFTFRPFGVAIKLIAEASDFRKTNKGHLVLRKLGSKKTILDISVFIKPTKMHRKKINSVSLAMNIGGAKFESFGSYILELTFGTKTIGFTKINVVQVKPK